jgi:S-adenosylmethionine:tRNA ribosyltransferase-isomerase
VLSDDALTPFLPHSAHRARANAAAITYASDNSGDDAAGATFAAPMLHLRPRTVHGPDVPHVERMQHPLTQSVSPKQRAPVPAGPSEAVAEGATSPLRTDALDYDLPADHIATHPAEPRDSARMLVLWRSDPSHIEHRHVRDLPEYLRGGRAGDALVFNDTAVAPARLEMRRASGGRVEGLFVEEMKPQNHETSERQSQGTDNCVWKVMLRSGGRIGVGERLTLIDHADRATDLLLRVVEHQGEEWMVKLEGEASTAAALERVGRTPLPPYIVKARREHHETFRDEQDRNWYQTVYADAARRQSVAAPTAGLHFTPDVLRRIEGMGVKRIDITLHVGPGTFKPVTTTTLDQHRMHAEWFEVSEQALRALRQVSGDRCQVSGKGAPVPESHGGRIIAVGTTTVRTLESLPAGALERAPSVALPDTCHLTPDTCSPEICGPIRGSTDLLIAPPHAFRHLDGMLTNFHLPRSTLLALVAAMVDVDGGGGLERLLAVYREAIERGYRFYSYGDAMLILP